jgi:hypothetical protein
MENPTVDLHIGPADNRSQEEQIASDFNFWRCMPRDWSIRRIINACQTSPQAQTPTSSGSMRLQQMLKILIVLSETFL